MWTEFVHVIYLYINNSGSSFNGPRFLWSDFVMDRVIQYRLIKLRNFSGFIFIFNMASIPTVDELKKLKVVELKQKLSELELPVQGACLLHLFYETKHFVFSTLMYKSLTRVPASSDKNWKRGQHFTRAFIVSDLWQVGSFLRVLVFPPPRYNLTIVNSGVTHHNKIKTPIQAVFSILLLRSDWEASDN